LLNKPRDGFRDGAGVSTGWLLIALPSFDFAPELPEILPSVHAVEPVESGFRKRRRYFGIGARP
jgi:hypothetical protein